MGSAGDTAARSRLKISSTVVESGFLPSATARIAISRSVMMPATRSVSGSITITSPMS